MHTYNTKHNTSLTSLFVQFIIMHDSFNRKSTVTVPNRNKTYEYRV